MSKSDDVTVATKGRADEICGACGCRRDRMIHSTGYSCEFEPSGQFERHPVSQRCTEDDCLACKLMYDEEKIGDLFDAHL